MTKQPLYFLKYFFTSVFILAFSIAQADDSNYQSYFVGDRAAGMGGAHTAFSDSPEGTFYNPGGVAFVEAASMSLSANVFRLTTGKISNAISIGSLREDLALSDINIIPTSAVALWPFNIGKEPPKEGTEEGALEEVAIKKNVFALSFYSPDFIAYEGKQDLSSGGIDAFLSYRTQDRTYYIGPTYSRRLTDNIGLGLSAFYEYRTFSRSTFFTDKEATSFLQLFDGSDFTYGGLVFIVGTKFLLPHNWHFGLSVRPIPLNLNGGGEIFLSSATDGAVSATNPTTVILQDLSVYLPSPTKITAGIGYDSGKHFAISGDVNLYLPHNFLAVHDPQGRLADLRIKQNMVLNGNLGVEYFILKNWPLRFGAFTNFSSADDPDTTASSSRSKIDFWGGSLAIGHESQHTSSQLGAQVSQGSGVIRTGVGNSDFSLIQISAMVSTLYRF